MAGASARGVPTRSGSEACGRIGADSRGRLSSPRTEGGRDGHSHLLSLCGTARRRRPPGPGAPRRLRMLVRRRPQREPEQHRQRQGARGKGVEGDRDLGRDHGPRRQGDRGDRRVRRRRALRLRRRQPLHRDLRDPGRRPDHDLAARGDAHGGPQGRDGAGAGVLRGAAQGDEVRSDRRLADPDGRSGDDARGLHGRPAHGARGDGVGRPGLQQRQGRPGVARRRQAPSTRSSAPTGVLPATRASTGTRRRTRLRATP